MEIQSQLESSKRQSPKPRVPFTEPVWIRAHSNTPPQQGLGSNLSETGIFIQTTDPPRVGSKVEVKFKLADSNEPVVALVEVIWIKPFEPINVDGLLPGMGARFVTPCQERTHRIRDFVCHRIPETNGNGHRRQVKSSADSVTTAPTASFVNYTKEPDLSLGMLMRIHGERKPIIGYTDKLSDTQVEFVTDFVPDSCLKALRTAQKQGNRQRDFSHLLLPTRISKVTPDSEDNPENFRITLDILELREDWVRSTLKQDGPSSPSTQHSHASVKIDPKQAPISIQKKRPPSRFGWIVVGFLSGLIFAIALSSVL